jgi:hypothetical protein
LSPTDHQHIYHKERKMTKFSFLHGVGEIIVIGHSSFYSKIEHLSPIALASPIQKVGECQKEPHYLFQGGGDSPVVAHLTLYCKVESLGLTRGQRYKTNTAVIYCHFRLKYHRNIYNIDFTLE